MKKLCLIVFMFTTIQGQYAPSISAAVSDDAGSLVLNPASLGISRQFNMLYLIPVDSSGFQSDQEDFSLYSQVGRNGFGFTHKKDDLDLLHWGSGQHFGKGFYFGNTSHFSSDGYEAIDMGMLYRGFRWFSGGIMWKNVWSRERGGSRADQLFDLSIAVRPFGSRLTLSIGQSVSLQTDKTGGNKSFSFSKSPTVQLHVEPLNGVKLFTSYNSQSIQVGVGVGFGKASVESYHDLDSKGEYSGSLIGLHFSDEIRRAVYRDRKPTYIELSFDRPLSDSPSPMAFFGPKTVTLKKLTDEIRKMAESPEIDGIILKPDQYASGLGMMEEVHNALREFKDSGKSIFAFIDAGGDRAYALATVADSIYLNSGGILVVDGLALSVGFLKGLFDKIGVEAQFYRRGDYKTAAEPFTRESLTETSREAYEAVLVDMHDVFSRMIVRGRGWSQEKLHEVYEGSLYTPPMALEAGLIDGLYHPDQIEKKLKEIAGKDVKIVKVRKRPKQWSYDWGAPAGPKVAIIYAEGPIVPGKSQPSPFGGDKVIGSKTTAKAIRKARENESVKAIVMRVNSGGGSILASEDIWREVHRTTHPDSSDEKYRKPFIISMANVAGSGGYYISCAADTIVADSSTITGSIGVLSGKISLGGLFEKIGYNVDVVKEQPHAEQFSSHRPFTDEEGQRMQAIVDSYYEQFLDRVSEGRGMSREDVDSVAQGRIWSGVDAKEIGLVDVLGGLDTAIEIAREKAGLEEGKYELKIYKGVEDMVFEFQVGAKSDFMSFIEAFESDISIALLLDRAKLINDERFLFLMEGELIATD